MNLLGHARSSHNKRFNDTISAISNLRIPHDHREIIEQGHALPLSFALQLWHVAGPGVNSRVDC